MHLRTNDRVRAVEAITEENFGGVELFTHARAGDPGIVLLVPDEEWADVYFEKTGTISICHVSELNRRL